MSTKKQSIFSQSKKLPRLFQTPIAVSDQTALVGPSSTEMQLISARSPQEQKKAKKIAKEAKKSKKVADDSNKSKKKGARMPIKDKAKIAEGQAELDSVKRYASKYVGSPGFNEKFDSRFIEVASEHPEYSWSYRLNPDKINKVKLKLWTGDGYSFADAANNTINMTEIGMGGWWPGHPGRRSMTHEMGHIIDDNVVDVFRTDKNGKKEKMQYSTLYNKQLLTGNEGRRILKAGIRSNNYLTSKEQDNLYSKYKDKYHDGFDIEPYADLFQMRYELDRLGLYDSTKANNKFTKEILDEFRRITNNGEVTNGGYKYRMAIKRILQQHSDDEIINMMNTVAKLDSRQQLKNKLRPDPSQAYYAKKGIRLIKKSRRR